MLSPASLSLMSRKGLFYADLGGMSRELYGLQGPSANMTEMRKLCRIDRDVTWRLFAWRCQVAAKKTSFPGQSNRKGF